METLAFILHNLPIIGERTLEHISIVAVAAFDRQALGRLLDGLLSPVA